MPGTNYKYLQCEELTEAGLSPRLSQTGKLKELRDNVHSRLYRSEGVFEQWPFSLGEVGFLFLNLFK